MKPSLRNACKAGKLPKSFDDINQWYSDPDKSSQEAFLRGYVKALLPGGVIIGFLGDVVGFVRKSRIADQFVSDPVRFLNMHQSCSAIVDSVDEDKKRFTLSMRLSDVGKNAYAENCIELFPCVEEWRSVLHAKTLSPKFKIGSIIEAAPSSIRPFGTLYNLEVGDSTVIGVAFNANQSIPDVILHDGGDGDKSAKEIDMEDIEANKVRKKGKQRLRILDIDPLSGVVDLSADQAVVSRCGKKLALSSEKEVRARVLLVKNAYIILAVEVSKNISEIAFALNPPIHDALQLRPGTLLKGKVIRASRRNNDRNLVAVDWARFQEKPLTDGKGRHVSSNFSDVTSVSVLKSTATQDESGVLGMQVAGKVTKSFSSHVFVGVGPGVVGHLHLKNTGNISDEDLGALRLGPLPQLYASRYGLPELGSIVRPAYVCGIRRHEDKQNNLPMVLDLALHKTSLVSKLEPGVKVVGFVQHVSKRFQKSDADKKSNKHATVVTVGSDTWISVYDVNCLYDDQAAVSIEPGTPVVCMISESEEGAKHLKGILSENGIDHAKEFLGIVRDVIQGHGVKVLVPWNARKENEKSTSWGMVDICDVSSDFEDVVRRMKELKEGDIVRVRRIHDPDENEKQEKPSICLTMRSSRSDHETRDPLVSNSTVAKLKPGQELRGFVRAVDKKVCFVSIGRGLSAHVKLCDLSDEFVADPELTFPVGTLIQ
eukprot:TRINITY_DN594_c0_g1_i2.p1 TRINITY_DN594_c0_g1~~TRINITY_DN594_c0_g1_i2.p1  ORF type:complete len:711 (-),score=97.54 TRINITY_DN594_c0_g1_i2:8349-10481(-)